MSMILLILDGLPDKQPTDSQPFYDNADCVNLAKMRHDGAYGCFDTVPHGYLPDSLTCIATLLGVEAQSLPRGRAYLEALSNGILVGENDAVCRCNLVEIDENGNLIGSGVRIEMPDKAQKYKLFRLGGYKNILLCADQAQQAANTYTMPPHEHIGEPVCALLPMGTPLADELREFALCSKTVVDGKTCMLFPWDVTQRQTLPSFRSLHNLSAAAVCAAEIVRGIALAMGIAAITPAGATAEYDTDLAAKAYTAVELAKHYDFVLVHVNGADELAHRRDTAGKAAFLARVDKELLGVLLAEAAPDITVLVTSDHATLSATGRHVGGAQPFVLYGSTTQGDLGALGGDEAVPLLKAANEKG